MENYEVLERIGEGAHGVVMKAKHIQSGELVALKKIPLRKLEDGIPKNIIREIKTLMALEDHYNVVKLFEVFPHGSGFVLVFEHMISDLSEVLRNHAILLSEGQIKCYMRMLLKGINHCHKHKVIHRDLKPANLLLSSSGYLKIGDFGLARVHCDEDIDRPQYSHQVATRWYRAPELLYGARVYNEGVDLWAVGCIFGELINNSPLFTGENDIDQLCCVIRILGTPNEKVWPNLTKLPDYNKISFAEMPPIPLEKIVPDASELAIDLIKRFLVYIAKDRISADKALVHSYFFTSPLPAHHSELPLPKSQAKVDLLQTFKTLQFDTAKLIPPSVIAAHAHAFITNNRIDEMRDREFEEIVDSAREISIGDNSNDRNKTKAKK